MTNAELVRRYIAAMIDLDTEALGKLRHKDWIARWPQSGEVVRGHDNMTQILASYPGGPPRLAERGNLVGSEDRWALSPLGSPYRVDGEGDSWWGDWNVTYSDGREWYTTILLELRDGQVYRETEYWSEPFEAPGWRSQWVETLSSS